MSDSILEEDMMKEDDLYGLLGVDPTGSDQEIRKAWRLKSRKCHPDKYPDNEEKHKMFIKITKAMDFLLEPKLRAVYDNRMKAQSMRLKRKKEMNETRRYFTDKLRQQELAREEESRVKRRKMTERENTHNELAEEIAKLRADGLRKIREEGLKKSRERSQEKGQCIVKLRWPKERVYNKQEITNILHPYGTLIHLVVGKKRNAVAVFSTPGEAVACAKAINANSKFSFKVTTTASSQTSSPYANAFPTNTSNSNPTTQNTNTKSTSSSSVLNTSSNKHASIQPMFFGHAGIGRPSHVSATLEKHDIYSESQLDNSSHETVLQQHNDLEMKILQQLRNAQKMLISNPDINSSTLQSRENLGG